MEQVDSYIVLTTCDWLAEVLHPEPKRAVTVRQTAIKTLGCESAELLAALSLLQVAFVVRDAEVWFELPTAPGSSKSSNVRQLHQLTSR